jgi:hypothetical protein
LGVLCCQICAPIAWALGHADLKAINAGRMDPEGRGLTQAGMVLGIIGTAMMIFFLGMQMFVVLLEVF